MNKIVFAANFSKSENMPYIHDDPEWPNLRWDEARLLSVLADIRHRQGRLIGKMEGMGFRLRAETSLSNLTADVTQSSAIEGERLDAAQVRSSIARRLGLDFGGEVAASRDVEGVVEMMLDATQKNAQPLTAERLFGWHAALFPTGRSGMQRITVGDWRPASAGPMQVVSGALGREQIHFQAPAAARIEREVQSFLDWYEDTNEVDPVLKAGTFNLVISDLFLYQLIEVSHWKSSESKTLAFKPISIPVFWSSPAFCHSVPKPVDGSILACKSKSSTFFL